MKKVRIGEQAFLLGEYLSQMPGNECFKIDDISTEEFLPSSVTDENFVMFIRVINKAGNPVPALACQTNAVSYSSWLSTGRYYTDSEGYCQVLAPCEGMVGIKLFDIYAKDGTKKENTDMWQIGRLNDNVDALLTLKWDGTNPYDSLDAQQNRLIVTVIDSDGLPVANMSINCITQDSYLYRSAEAVSAPAAPAPPSSFTDTDGRAIITGLAPAPLKVMQLIVGNERIHGKVWRKDFRYWGGEQAITIVIE